MIPARAVLASICMVPLLAASAGCQRSPATPPEGGAAAAPAPPPELSSQRDLDAYVARPAGTLTFTKDIAPIVFDNCAACHRPGEAAPFALLGYDDVRKRAKQIVEVTGSGYMPPWLPAAGYNEFHGARRLSVDEIGMLHQWVREGAEQGDPRDLPPVPTWTPGWQLGEPDLVVRLPETYELAAGGPDVFRNFVIADLVSEDRYVSAMEFRPGNAQIVHHAEFRIDRSEASRRLDAADAEPGFGGMDADTAQMPDGHFLGWVPGQTPSPVPEGMAWRLGKDTDLVIQLHMLPSGKPERVDPQVGLHFTDRPPTRIPFVINLASRTIDIPPGTRDYRIRDSFTLPVDVDVLSVFPHAHYLGKDMKGYATLPDGTRRWLLRIKEWDFNWQDDFEYEEPISLPAGTVLTMEYSYDNTAENVRNPHYPPRRVEYGPSTFDEMGDLWIQVLPRDEPARRLLADAFYRHNLRREIHRFETYVRRNPDDPVMRNNLGHFHLEAGRIDEAVPHFREAVRLDPGYAHGQKNLGIALYQIGQVDEGLAHLHRALQADPQDADGHFTLARLLAERGRTEEALAAFDAALAAREAYPEARFFFGRTLQAAGRSREALEQYKETLRLEPDWVVPLRTTAWLLATHPDDDLRDPLEAIRLAERAAELTENRDPLVLEALAAGYAAAGRFPQAVRTARAALSRLDGRGARIAARIQHEMELYRNARPYIQRAPGQG